MPEWITAKTASRKANVSDRTIRNWINKGKLIAKKEKGRWLIDDSSLQKFGNYISDYRGKSESPEIVSVPLKHYDSLMTRLGQLEAENSQYRKMLEAHENKLDKHQEEITELRAKFNYYRTIHDF